MYLRDSHLNALLAKHGVSGSGIRVDMSGFLHVPREMNVLVRHKGGSSSGGVLRLYIDGKELSSVGDDRSKDKKHNVMLGKGDHAVRWNLRGGHLGGGNHIAFFDPDSGQPLPVYCPSDIAAQLRAMPHKEEVDISSR